jgi:aflatoxin B1 aldehyde reductase
MDTKFYPNVHGAGGQPVTHFTPKEMREALEKSLATLGTEKVDLWYLHAPDRSVPIAETLKGVNELWKEGRFEKWGVSNYMAWEVAQICEICRTEG